MRFVMTKRYVLIAGFFLCLNFLFTTNSLATTAQIHNTAGLAYFYQGKYAQAFEEFLAAVKKDPNNIVAHFNLGRIFERQGKYRDAFVQYQRTLSLDPAHDQARQGYKRLIRFKAKPKLRIQSEDEILEEKIIKNDIRSEAAKEELLAKRILRIEEHFSRKSYEAAFEVVRRTLEVFPNEGDLYFYLGRYYFVMEQYKRASEELNRALRLGVKEEDVTQYLLALAYENLGDFGRAERALRRATSLAPSNSVYYERLGIILVKQGKDATAYQKFREGVKVNPASVETRVKLNKLSKELSLQTFHNGKLAFERREYEQANELLTQARDYGQLSSEELEETKMLLRITDYWLSKARRIERVREVQRKRTQNIKHQERVSFAEAVEHPEIYLGRYISWSGKVLHVKEKLNHYEVLVDLNQDNEFQEDLEMRTWVKLHIDGKRPDDKRLSYLGTVEFEGKYKDWEFLKNPWNKEVSIRKQPVVYLTEGKFRNENFASGFLRVFPEIDYKN